MKFLESIKDFLADLVGSTPDPTEPPVVAVIEEAAAETPKEADKPADDFDRQIVTVAHAVFLAIAEHESGHPLVQRYALWIDGLLQTYGESLLETIEARVLTVLAMKYPALAAIATLANEKIRNRQPPFPPAAA